MTPDYQFAIGTSTGGISYTFTLNGAAVASGPITQLALFHFDTSLDSASGVSPSAGANVAYALGRFGQGMYVQSGIGPTYPGSLLNTFEGTIEMWIAPRFNGNDAIFANTGYTLFKYAAGNGDSLAVGFDGQHTGRILFTGASVNGQPESAYSGAADISTWKTGEWHHVAATFSASSNHIRFYLDGAKVADNNEGHYYPPSASGGSVQIGTTTFAVDEVRISNVALSDAAIAYNAGRSTPFGNNEVLVSMTNVSPGQLTYSVNGCGSASYSFSGIPISNVNPSSNLLAPGSTSVALTFNTSSATTCAYSVGTSLPFGSMQSFDSGQPTTSHGGTVVGLSADPSIVNHVYLRCASNPDYEAALLYRSVANPNGAFPRIGTIWWGGSWSRTSQASKLQLYLGQDDPAIALHLRSSNPNVLVLPEQNATSTVGGGSGLTAPMVPDAYFLKDVNGNRIANFPGNPCSCLLNLTKPEVGEFIANHAYQILVQSGLAFDGIFFDNFFTSISWLKTDVNGQPIQFDADGDGRPDNPAALDAAWRAGVYHMVEAFRKLVPYGYTSGHLDTPPSPASLANFNGNSFVGIVESVREGRAAFVDLLQAYQQWFAQGVAPVITMVQSQPPEQIAEGYGYAQAMPAATAEFARTFYPNMRFGLALTLMNDGFFAHDFGDPSQAVTWWYDEYDFDLGFPLGPAALVGGSTPTQVYRRDYSKGVVLLNGTSSPQTITLEPGFRRFQGLQAPRYQYIVDDAGATFSTVGAWNTACSTPDVTGPTPALNGPYYHAWKGTCHELDSGPGSVQWDLAIPADGQYTIQAWLPAAPNAGSWTNNAVYEIVSGGSVISTVMLDQSTASSGDQWHTIASVNLSVAGAPTLRLRNGGSGSLIADAIYVTSSALFNDGSSTTSITLGPFDGILLKRDSADTELRVVVEYYNSSLDHYFITWVAAEQANLDAGNTPTKWNRTGSSFKTHTIPQTGTSPVCRYYIPPAKGDSHFFGRGTAECNETGQKNPTFVLEDPDFMNMFLPMNGTCPTGTTNVYRVFDNRPDANHRYMTDKTVRDAMLAKGWSAEGDGPDLVVMCAPQ